MGRRLMTSVCTGHLSDAVFSWRGTGCKPLQSCDKSQHSKVPRRSWGAKFVLECGDLSPLWIKNVADNAVTAEQTTHPR